MVQPSVSLMVVVVCAVGIQTETESLSLLGVEMSGYWCVYCMRFLPSEDGVITHDDVVHPTDMTFDERPNQ